MFTLSFLFDAFCFFSIIGIWPRFIEPRLLRTRKIKIPFTQGLKIVQISDVHYQKGCSLSLLSQVHKEAPDCIVFTGDFICNGFLDDREGLKTFLSAFKAPLGVYAVLGNHDYNQGIHINQEGDYDVVKEDISPVLKGFKRLLFPSKLTKKRTQEVQALRPHPELLNILQELSIVLLDNRTVQLGNKVNLTGVGEYMAGKVDVEIAFKGYNPILPGIVLAHNPDAFPLFSRTPAQLVLSGHTHGGQINLPWFWKRFTALENPRYKAGVFQEGDKTLIVSRGVGGILPFRFNAVPEIISISLGGS